MAALRAYATQITTDGPFFALSNNVGESRGATSSTGSSRASAASRRGRARDRPVRRGLRRLGLAGLALLCLLVGAVTGARHGRACTSLVLGPGAWVPPSRGGRVALPPGWWTRLAFALGWVAAWSAG